GKMFFGFQMRGSYIIFLVAWIFVLLSMFSIGLLVGSIAKDTKSASVIASILYFPMIIFSGATLPYEVMPHIMQRIVDILPLTQGIKMLKSAVLGLPLNNLFTNISIMIILISVCIGISVKFFRWQ
ncbi:MAG: ABC transporter permease, partial [Clostridium sp.]